MKNFFKILGIIALIAIIGLSMAACPEDDGGGGPTAFGDKLEIKGEQVYTREGDFPTYEYKKFEGNLSLTNTLGGSGKIEGGKLTYTIEVPSSLSAITFFTDDLVNNMSFTDVKISDESVKAALFQFIDTANGSAYPGVHKWEMSGKLSGDILNAEAGSVVFMYVDKDVTITAKGRTSTEYGETYTLKDLNLSLKKGWNAILNKQSGPINVKDGTGSSTISLSVDNPDLKWVLFEK